MPPTHFFGFQIDDVLEYWESNLNELRESRPTNVKTPYRFDVTRVITILKSKDFSFAIGDFIDSKSLLYNDSTFQANLLFICKRDNMYSGYVTEKNIDYWNKNYAAGKFQLSEQSLNEILAAR